MKKGFYISDKHDIKRGLVLSVIQFCKNLLLASLLFFFVLFPFRVSANVIITVANASNLTNPGYTALGNMVIMEGAATDIAQAGGTLLLDCPAGFEFQPGVGSAYSSGAPDITSATMISVTATQITISVTGNGGGSACCDQITISGIYVRAAALCPVASNGNITKNAASTQMITGVTNGITSFGTLTQATTSLTTGAITGSPFCQGAAVNVPFIACGFNAGNTFTAQLSDATGSFVSPTVIGTLSAIASGTINATIPAGTAPGTAYRIRVVAGNPVATGADNGSNLTINAALVTGSPSYTPVCPGGAISVPYTIGAGCTAFSAGNIFTAQLSDANGSFAVPVNIGTLGSTASGTITATIPAGTPPGNGYRIRVVSSNPSITGTANSASATVTKNLYASHLNWQIFWVSGDQFDVGDVGSTIQFGANPPTGQNDVISTAYWPVLPTSCGTAFGMGTYITFPSTQARMVNFNGPAAFTIATLATLPFSTAPICNGSVINVKYCVPTSCITFAAGNVFTAQLSDASGSFAAPTDIGSISSTTSGTISATVPSGTNLGSGYRIRVVASNPATAGTDNGADLTNQSITASISGNNFCANISIGVSFVVACPSALNPGNVFTAELSNPSGGFSSGTTVLGTLASTAASGTILAAIPSGTTASGLYRIRVKSSNTAFTGADNGTDLTITAPCNPLSATFIETIGTTAQSAIYSVQLTDAGGYTVLGNAGTSNANPGDYYPNVVYLNTQDIFLANLNADGSLLWQKSYAVAQYNAYYHVLRHEKTADGGFIISGGIDNGCSPSGPSCYTKPLLIKTLSDGTIQWSKTYDCYLDIFHWGGWAFSVKQTTDGGFIVCGPQQEGYSVPFLMKTDANGNVTWKYSYGSNGGAICCTSEARAVRQTSDGGYVLLSPGGDFSMGGGFDLIKVNSSGALSWSTSFHYGFGTGGGYDLQVTADGGFIITGNSTTGGIFLVKTNSTGTASWGKTFSYGGGMSNAVQQTSDGGYVVTGTAGGHVVLIKTTSTGTLSWAKSFNLGATERGMDVKQTPDGGYVIAGYTGSSGNKGLLIKTDMNGNSSCAGTDITALITTGSGVTTGAIAFGAGATSLPTGSTVQSITAGNAVSANVICSAPAQETLPIGLVDFDAKLMAGKEYVLATWTTASEWNNDYFTVERSTDAKTFVPLGMVKGAGNSTQTRQYHFEDFAYQEGINYYRLKQTDFDGKFSYSQVVGVQVEGDILEVTVFPNPVNDQLNVIFSSNREETLSLMMCDLTGKVVYTTVTTIHPEQNLWQIDTGNFEKGIYCLKISGTYYNKVFKVIKTGD